MSTLKKFSFILVFFIFGGTTLFSQLTHEDYKRADAVDDFNELVYNAYVSTNWIEDTYHFWYEVSTQKGDEYFLVDAEELEKQPAFDQEKLAELLKQETEKEHDPYDLPLRDVSFNEQITEMTFVVDSVKYKLDKETYELNKIKELEPEDRDDSYWSETDDELTEPPVVSPDSVWEAYIEDYNVHIKNRENDNVYQLSFDGSKGEYYSSHIQWAPNSEYLATNKIRRHTKRYIHFIESAPDDQLQPKTHKLEYAKPGDALQIRKPSLFNVEEKEQISVEADDFLHQFNLTTPQWREDSRAFTFEFNQRGHQVYQVVEVNAADGDVNVLIDERTETFIDYSGKRFRHDVNDGEEIIWASERNGWNHLYLYDGSSGTVKDQITEGEWVVRGVEHVNENERYIIFRGAGRHEGEDPYLVRYYRINFDGSGLTELTPERANHNATFSSDNKYFVDNYSRVDQAPKTVLRRAEDGEVSMELEEADISELKDEGWNAPEVFVAKGRDGETDIWGIIHRPTNFDPSKTYPVIEYIYAGPHSAFVPKSFRPRFGQFSALAELGFIIVQIDGMGTSHRSKEFHDVAWQNLKDAGFPDRIEWIKAAAEQYPYMDTGRVGIFGRSAGGQSAMGALLFHNDFYDAAVAAVGCHDNRMDKIWWNEQWMGYPIGPHYEESSNVDNAHKLQGDLLLTVGELDRNVDPSSTLQVVDALIKAGKDFEYLMYPGQGHGFRGKYAEYEERQKRDFFVRHLLDLDPPDWNKINTK